MNSYIKTRTVSYPELEDAVQQLTAKAEGIYTYAELITKLNLEHDVQWPEEEFYFLRYFSKHGELTVRPSGKGQFLLVYIGDGANEDVLVDSPSLALNQEEDREYFLEKRPFQPFDMVKVRKYTCAEGVFYRWVEVTK